jgi:glucose-6-phosphate 1-dehydrogenase
MSTRPAPPPAAGSPSPLASGLLVIFGVTGDLSRRYLLPALVSLAAQDLLPEHFEIIGASRRHVDVAELLAGVTADAHERGQALLPEGLTRIQSALRIVTMDPTVAADYAQLKTTLDRIEDERGVCLNRLFYLSVPPHTYGPIVDLLAGSGLNVGCQHGSADSRIMVEKPFGYDLESAQDLIKRLHANFAETQIYRIDHYLAKETAQNILTFRFANPIFQAVWNADFITGLTITASETIGIEDRAVFYESTGALRDFVQNHLLQLLALTTMEEPSQLDSAQVHAEKLKLLQSIVPVAPNQVGASAVRGQYQGYRDEVGNPDSNTETFARLRLRINNPRWKNVPVMLQTGKRLDQRFTEISITFAGRRGHAPNTLCFRIQPGEGIAIDLRAKKPGLDNVTEEVEMAFNYKDYFGAGAGPTAYERVLTDGIRGDQTLFTSSEEVLTSWRIVDAVVKAWGKSGDGLKVFAPGTPAASL